MQLAAESKRQENGLNYIGIIRFLHIFPMISIVHCRNLGIWILCYTLPAIHIPMHMLQTRLVQLANVQGTYQLLDYASMHQCERFFFFSSVEIYGENKNDVNKFSEDYLGYIDCNTTRAGYCESKRLGESLCNAFATQKEQDFIIGRFSRVYGPTMSLEDSKAIAQFIKKAVAGEDIVLKSEGNQLYSYTYVVDAATAALYLLLKGENGSAVNVADNASDIKLKDLAKLFAKEAGTKVIFQLPDAIEKAGFSTATKAVLDSTKIMQLGWNAMTPIEQGISKTIQILRQTKEGAR